MRGLQMHTDLGSPSWRSAAYLLGFQAIGMVAAFMVALSAASSVAPAGTAAKRGGTLEFAVLVEPGNFDCHANISFAFLHPIAPHYSTLLKFDAPNYPQIVGDLAESWSVSPDHLTYTFKLRPNVLFHDGSKLTSTDVKASYERIAHPPPGVVSLKSSERIENNRVDCATAMKKATARRRHAGLCASETRTTDSALLYGFQP